ncbi:GIY-YIG nuclease family protein [Corynebacterium ulcerans]|uniref:GIY-YIG nuclease family protein n=1 Tax=Corynebacterium ulcerans TaxID=65058 RepID=UPI000C77FDEE|nr:GIY-YIG nuclease family protein [Corynebacterium ulcerans]PLW01257.1 helicase [Corynebacterium ulcerans]
MSIEEKPQKLSSVEAALDALFSSDVDGLLDEPEKPKKLTSGDRLERGFEEINEFFEAHGRIPNSTTQDIAERKLGARLDGIRINDEKIDALKHLDRFGLLVEPEAPASVDDLLEHDDFGLLEDDTGIMDVSSLPQRKKPITEVEVARRKKCEDFGEYAPLFRRKHSQLASGQAEQIPFAGLPTIDVGKYFVLNGLMLFIAECGESEIRQTSNKNYRRERLRVIFENGTESAMWRQSLGIRLGEGDGRSIVDTIENSVLADETPSGWIYILRSLSTDPQITEVPNLYKIGFTRQPVEKRIAGAERQPTYLMAPVEVVATYRTYDIKTSVLEHLIHRVFVHSKLSASVADNDGKFRQASEWFSVPLEVINEAIDLIGSGGIINYVYDPTAQELKPIDQIRE